MWPIGPWPEHTRPVFVFFFLLPIFIFYFLFLFFSSPLLLPLVLLCPVAFRGCCEGSSIRSAHWSSPSRSVASVASVAGGWPVRALRREYFQKTLWKSRFRRLSAFSVQASIEPGISSRESLSLTPILLPPPFSSQHLLSRLYLTNSFSIGSNWQRRSVSDVWFGSAAVVVTFCGLKNFVRRLEFLPVKLERSEPQVLRCHSHTASFCGGLESTGL